MARSKKAPGHFERRGQSWRWRVCIGGRYHRFTIPTTDRAEAEAWARKKFEELNRHHTRRMDGVAVGVRFSDLLTYFEEQKLPRLAPGTQEAYRDSLKPLRLYFVERQGAEGDLPLERIRAAHVIDFLDWRRVHRIERRPLPDGTFAVAAVPGRTHLRTVAKDRAVLHRLFEVAQEHEWRDGNPAAKVAVEEADTRQPVILDAAQYDALVTACRDSMVRLYVLLCGETGVRCESEALWVRWDDVDLEGGFVTVVSGRGGHRTKGGKTRHVPLTARLSKALREHFARHRLTGRSEWVFHHLTTRRHFHAGARVHSFRRAVASAATRAKLPDGWVMHDLRHRRVTTWLAEGKSPVLVKEALGHADLRTTMEYTHLVKDHLRALVEPSAASLAQAQ